MDTITLKMIDANRLPACDSTVMSLNNLVDTIQKHNSKIVELLFLEQQKNDKNERLLKIETEDKEEQKNKAKRNKRNGNIKTTITGVGCGAIGIIIGVVIKTLTP